MVTYKVTLLSEEHDIDATIDCNDYVFLLDAAECKSQYSALLVIDYGRIIDNDFKTLLGV